MPELMKYDLTVFKATSASDSSQVPAEATVYFYFQGADYASGGPITDSGTSITVDDIGFIKPGDTLEVFSGSAWGSGTAITVTSVDSQTTMTLTSASGDITVSNGDRLVITNRSAGDKFPRIYSDERMSSILNTESSNLTTDANETTSSTTGELDPVYVAARMFDVVIAVSGEDKILRRNQTGGSIDGPTLEDEGVSFDSASTSAARNAVHLNDHFERVSRAGVQSGTVRTPKGTAIISEDVEMDKNASAWSSGGVEGDLGSIVQPASGFSDGKMFYISKTLSHSVMAIRNQTFNDANTIASLNALQLDKGITELWIENCRFTNILGSSIKLGQTGGADDKDRIKKFWVNGNVFEIVGSSAIPVIDCDNLLWGEFCSNIFTEPSGVCINIVPPTAATDHARQILIDGNTFYATSAPSKSPVVLTGGATAIGTINQSFDIRITGNSVNNFAAPMVTATNMAHMVVSGNVVTGDNGLIKAVDCFGGNISGNSVSVVTGAKHAIEIEGGVNISVTGNALYHSSPSTPSSGVYMNEPDYCTVTGNVIDGFFNNVSAIVDASYNNIVGNNILNATNIGIYISDSNCVANRIEANILQGNNSDISDGSTTTVNKQDVETPEVTTVVTGQSPYAALSTDRFIYADTSGGNIEIDLLAAASGNRITIKNSTSANTLTIDQNGTETIDGATTPLSVTTDYRTITLVPISGGWLIESEFDGTFDA